MTAPYLTLSAIAADLGGHWFGPPEVRFEQVAIDSRRLTAGQLFIALKGERFDGHDYLTEVAAKGACAALVARRQPQLDLPQLVVADVRLALGRLGKLWRERFFTGQLVALTGSNGKTTTKQMLAAILASADTTLATEGNLNNDLGVPLTLLRLRPEHRYAVIEMGANHAGEIAYLVSLALPQVALITNAGPAHLEGFGDLPGVAKAKGEIYGGLASDGIAVINGDDRFADFWRTLVGERRSIEFAIDNPAATVRGRWRDQREQTIELTLRGERLPCRLPLPGRHSLANALAAAAAAHGLGLDGATIVRGLEQFRPVGGRMQVLSGGANGMVVIDDTYNANPASLTAALEVLGQYPRARRWVVLGDMAELGRDAGEHHAQCGAQMRQGGVERLFTLGEHSRAAAQAFGAGAYHAAAIDALQERLLAALQEPDIIALPPVILVKGSRSMRMERVVEQLALRNDLLTESEAGV